MPVTTSSSGADSGLIHGCFGYVDGNVEKVFKVVDLRFFKGESLLNGQPKGSSIQISISY